MYICCATLYVFHSLDYKPISPEHPVCQCTECVGQLGDAGPEFWHLVVGEHGVDVAHVVALPHFVDRDLRTVAFLEMQFDLSVTLCWKFERFS